MTTCQGYIQVQEEDDLVLMEMMGERNDYENNWIIDSGCSNHMIDYQSGATEAMWSRRKKFLPYLNNIEETLQ